VRRRTNNVGREVGMKGAKTYMLSFSRPFATWFRKSRVNMCKQT